MEQAKEKMMTSEVINISDEKLLKQAMNFAETKKISKGEEIVLNDTDANSFYYVQKGAVEVSYTAKETRITVAMIGAGNFLGEIGFLDSGSRVRDIRVMEDTELKIFSSAVMTDFLAADPKLYGSFLAYLTKSICGKFRRILDEREPLQAYGASLAIGNESYDKSTVLPDDFLNSDAWKTVSKIVNDFIAQIYTISHELQKKSTSNTQETIRRKGFKILDEFYQYTLKMDSFVSPNDVGYAWGYIFKEIFPYFMRSRFAERIYFKPKGYAGDFMMMEMIYINKPSGDGYIGEIVDEWCLNSIGAQAIRGRRKLLCQQLHEMTSQKIKSQNIVKIMNLACGPNRELFDFLSQCDYTEKIEALCIDIDSDALQYTNTNVNIFPHSASIRLLKENIVKWSLGRVQQNIEMQDIIYSAGLTDYLEEKLFVRFVQRCYEHLKPGGIMIVGNFAPNADQPFMDHILQWRLIYRNKNDLRHIFSQTDFGDNIVILSEKKGVNLFVKATK